MTVTNNFLFGNPENLLNSASNESSKYSVNSLGYRTSEFDSINWNDAIVVFGCSYVFGIGLQDSETITNQLSQLLNRPVINMGVPASSISYSFFNQMTLAELNIAPHAIVNLWTSVARQTYFCNRTPFHLGPWMESKENTLENRKLKSMFDLWNFDDSNVDIHAKNIQRASRLIWKGTKHIEGTFFPSTSKALDVELFSIVDSARDEKHLGPQTAARVAERLAIKLL